MAALNVVPRADSWLSAETCVPSDSAVPAIRPNGWYVGGAGAVSVLLTDGTNAVFAAMPVGSQVKLPIQRINSTGTTATNLLYLY